MPTPTPAARTALDNSAQELAQVGGGLVLDDFRPAQTAAAVKTSYRVKLYIIAASLLFLGLFLLTAVGLPKLSWFCNCGSDGKPDDPLQFGVFLALWALSLGGLGATASIFLHVLKLTPQETLRTSDEFDVFGRLILGCLFSTIFGLTFAATEVGKLYTFMHVSRTATSTANTFDGNTLMVLLPFFAGYSIPLVLKVLEKLMRAVELTIGVDDPRDPTNRRPGRRGGRTP